jgi:hypothetical protein
MAGDGSALLSKKAIAQTMIPQSEIPTTNHCGILKYHAAKAQ